MALIRASSGSGGGSAEMSVVTYSAIASSNTYKCTMKNGVYYTVKTDSSPQNSFIKGYVEDGVITKVYTHSGFTVAYDTATNELSVTLGSVSSTNTLYFFIFD